MADLGRIVAGAVGGVADYGLDQLKSRQDEEREVRKAKLLEDLRASTAERLATFEDNLRRKQGDKAFSAAEGDNFVIRNNRGEEVNRRALSEEEKRARQLGLDTDAAQLANVQDQIRSRRAGDARESTESGERIRALRARGSGASLDGESAPTNVNSLAQGLVNRYKGMLGDGDGKVDELLAFDLAQEAIEYAAQTNGDTKVAEDYFLNKLRGTKGTSTPAGRKVKFVE